MLVVPVFLTVSTLHPDILLFLMSTKKVIIIELTCCYKENVSQWHEEKSQKYHSLCSSIRSRGWHFGFCTESVRSCLCNLGLHNKLCRKTLHDLSSISLKCSCEIWLCRNLKAWLQTTQYLSLTLNQCRENPIQMEYLPLRIV